MSDTIETTAESVSSMPIERKPSFVSAVFGQLKDPNFWVDLVRVVLSEALNAFLMAFGGSLLYYGSQRRDTKLQNITATATGTQVGSSPVAQRAFGGAYSPNPSYQPSQSYPVPISQPAGDARFPGFGGPR